MILLKRISDAMEQIECKKYGLCQSLLAWMEDWKNFEQCLEMTGTRLKECLDELESSENHLDELESSENHLQCFAELESREKHLHSIQESIDKSLKELELVRESIDATRKQVEDKDSQLSRYADDLKLRQTKLEENEMSLEEYGNSIEEKFNEEINEREKKFQERVYELNSREEKLKQQENELKARQEQLDSAPFSRERKPIKVDSSKMQMDFTKELAETSSQLSPKACDSREKSRKRSYCSENPMKRSKAGKSSEYGEEEKTISMDVDGKNLSGQQLNNADNADLAMICSGRIVRIESESESDTDDEGITQVWDCPRAKFHNFDKENEIGKFHVDQVWACYDDLDGMPRLYARVEKVFTPKFKLQMVWLEADTEENHWTNHELSVSCGRFRLRSSLDVSNRHVFSHQMQCKRDIHGYYLIYPTKGETWAIWSAEQLEEYEIVEVLSDFVDDVGITVSYLDKVSGFVSIFERRCCGSASFVIPANELRRFSHKVPSFKLTQTIKECFELDPASLPNYPDNARYNEKVMVEYEAGSG